MHINKIKYSKIIFWATVTTISAWTKIMIGTKVVRIKIKYKMNAYNIPNYIDWKG